jgi:hypothetical protein
MTLAFSLAVPADRKVTGDASAQKQWAETLEAS